MGAIESASQVPLLCDFAQQIGEKSHIRNQHSPIANLEHPSALSLAIRYARKVIDKADCIRMFQIGDRRMLIAYFRTEFVQARFVGQSPPCQGESETLGFNHPFQYYAAGPPWLR